MSVQRDLARAEQLLGEVDRHIVQNRLLRARQGLVVAVSGGLDSVVLLHMLSRLGNSRGWLLAVAHFNHLLRGQASDADEAFVRAQAVAVGAEIVCGREDVRRYSKTRGMSVEMAARQLRHRFLVDAARGFGCRTVALAHQADDQVELFFLRALRGAGGEGLRGMAPKGPSPIDPRIALIRPLLVMEKSELAEYAEALGIRCREDRSNRSLDVPRNRLRHSILPELRRMLQPGLTRTVLRTMDVVGAEGAMVSEMAGAWLKGGGERTAFEDLPLALQRRVLQLQLRSRSMEVSFDLVETLRLNVQRSVCVGPREAIWRDREGGLHVDDPSRADFAPEAIVLELENSPGAVTFAGVDCRWRYRSGGAAVSELRRQPRGVECFDADKVGSPVVLRHWRPGDRFQPIGMSRLVKLQDLLTNAKVARNFRRRLVLATTMAGEVFWVEGLRVSERFKLDRATRRRLRWAWRRF